MPMISASTMPRRCPCSSTASNSMNRPVSRDRSRAERFSGFRPASNQLPESRRAPGPWWPCPRCAGGSSRRPWRPRPPRARRCRCSLPRCAPEVVVAAGVPRAAVASPSRASSSLAVSSRGAARRVPEPGASRLPSPVAVSRAWEPEPVRRSRRPRGVSPAAPATPSRADDRGRSRPGTGAASAAARVWRLGAES